MRTSWKDAFSKSAFKAVICIAIVFMMTCTVLLSACSSNKQSESPTTSNVEKLTILGKETDLAKTYMKKIFEMYESQTGKKINLISVPDADFNDVVKKKFESKDYPDILMHFNNTLLSSLDIENNFEYLNNQPWVSDLTEAVVQYCTDDSGNLLGLPFWENSVSGCYYNKTILNSLGLKPASSQAEFDRLCAALKSIGRTPLYWGDSSCSWMYQFALDPIFVKNPELIEKLNSGEITYAEIPEVRDMIQWIADAFANGWVDMNKNGSTWDDMSGALNSGNAVMINIWDTWFDTDFVGGKYTKNDFAVMPVFMNTDPKGTYEGGNLNMMMVCKNSSKVDEALEFLDFCANKDNYNVAFDGVATVKVFNNQTTNVQSKMTTEAWASLEKDLNVSTAEPKIKGYDTVEMGEIIMKMVNGEISVDQCLEMLDEARLS